VGRTASTFTHGQWAVAESCGCRWRCRRLSADGGARLRRSEGKTVPTRRCGVNVAEQNSCAHDRVALVDFQPGESFERNHPPAERHASPHQPGASPGIVTA